VLVFFLATTIVVFIVAVSSAAVGYVIMSYIMTATPISMHVIDGFSLAQTKLVIQSHVIAMFLPSLFTPIVVKLFGLSKMMIIGVDKPILGAKD
jgi:hypothetical protein